MIRLELLFNENDVFPVHAGLFLHEIKKYIIPVLDLTT